MNDVVVAGLAELRISIYFPYFFLLLTLVTHIPSFFSFSSLQQL